MSCRALSQGVFMFSAIAKLVLGSPSARTLKKYEKKVAAINALEPSIAALSDEQLKAKTSEFRARIAQGETVDNLLPEAFAWCARPPSAYWASAILMCS
jgi:preprotein translocase subunit SecA